VFLEELEVAAQEYYKESNGSNSKKLPNLNVFKREEISDLEAFVYEPIVCLILRGAKETSIGSQSVSLKRGDALLVSHELPVISKIVQASVEQPYLALILTLDLGIVRSLSDQVGEVVPDEADARSLSVRVAEESWFEPFGRYLDLMGDPIATKVMGPLILREIHFKLLMSDIGGMMRNLLSVDSRASQIAIATSRIREGFQEPLAVTELAREIGMSQSSFHTHFKAITGTTPLQYQKDLRMIEAQKLLRGGGQSVSTVSLTVGYESSTHFSRDYSRKFGCSPKHHLA